VTPCSLPRDFDPRASPRGGPALGELSDSRVLPYSRSSSALARADVVAKPSPGGDWPYAAILAAGIAELRRRGRYLSGREKLTGGKPGCSRVARLLARTTDESASALTSRLVAFASRFSPRCGNSWGEEEESKKEEIDERARRENRRFPV